MKKLLPLLALVLQADIEPVYSQTKAREETEKNIETLTEIYEHPKARKVGDLMPQPLQLRGEIVSYIHMYASNGEGIKGLVIGYSINKDKIAEYNFLVRECDYNNEIKTYAVYDAPHKKLYIDSSRNNRIDSIVEGIDSLEMIGLPIIPVKCEENEPENQLLFF